MVCSAFEPNLILRGSENMRMFKFIPHITIMIRKVKVYNSISSAVVRVQNNQAICITHVNSNLEVLKIMLIYIGMTRRMKINLKGYIYLDP